MYDVHAFFRTPLVLYIARPPPDRFKRPRRPCSCSCSSLGLEVRLRKRICIRPGSGLAAVAQRSRVAWIPLREPRTAPLGLPMSPMSLCSGP
jgi:hypothetical protein